MSFWNYPNFVNFAASRQPLIALTYIYTFWKRENMSDKPSRKNEPPKNYTSPLFWCFKNACFSILILRKISISKIVKLVKAKIWLTMGITRNYHYKTHVFKAPKYEGIIIFWGVHHFEMICRTCFLALKIDEIWNISEIQKLNMLLFFSFWIYPIGWAKDNHGPRLFWTQRHRRSTSLIYRSNIWDIWDNWDKF